MPCHIKSIPISGCYVFQRGLILEVQHLAIQTMRTCQTFHSAPQPNSALHADAKAGHAFGIFVAGFSPSALTGFGAGELGVRHRKV